MSRKNDILPRITLNPAADFAEADKNLRKDFENKAYDKSSPSYERLIAYDANREFKESRDKITQLYAVGGNYIGCRRENFQIERASEAISHFAKEASERFSSKFPSLNIEKEFIRINAGLEIAGYEWLDELDSITLGAALFMLDELDSSGLLPRAKKYLPTVYEDYEVRLPFEFDDSKYDNFLIIGMMQLIKTRNLRKDELAGDSILTKAAVKRKKDKVKYPESSHYPLYEQEKFVRSDEEIAAMTNRQKFDAVFAMIRPVVRNRAEKRFIDKQWEACEAILTGISCYQNDLDKAIRRYENAFHTLMSNINASKSALLNSSIKMPGDEINPDYIFGYTQAIDGIGHVKTKITEYLVYALNFQIHDLGLIKADVKEEAINRLSTLSVNNPIESCFAFLSLLDSGSDYPWLIGLGNFVLSLAYNQLPWQFAEEYAEDYYCPESDEEDYEEDFEETDEDAEAAKKAHEQYVEELLRGDHIEDFHDWDEELAPYYDIKYTDPEYSFYKESSEKPARRMNLAQIVYNYTNVVLPRSLTAYSGISEDLIEGGFDSSEAKMMELLLEITECVRGKEKFDKGFEEFKKQAKRIEKPSEREDIEKEPDLKKLIKDLRLENDNLKATIREYQEREKDAISYRASVEQESKAEHLELLKLRQLLIDKREEESIEKVFPEIKFPYETSKKIVSFGGHESWLTVIRELLPDVRFVDANTNPGESLILNADEIWIQSNAIAHSRYYKIMKLVREHHIPFQYFSYASAEKCAQQLAEHDSK